MGISELDDADTLVPGILTEDQLTDDTEVYLLRVPSSVPVPDLHNIDINLKSPGRIFVGEKQFSPVVSKGEHGTGPKTFIMPTKQGVPSPLVVEVKGIVTLREAVQVPAVPKIEIPPPYKVPSPGEAVVRHPIYGREIPGRKRTWEEMEVKTEAPVADDDSEIRVKKKKKKDKKRKESLE